jgi:hypothetical protein
MTFEMLMEEKFEAGVEKGAYNKSLETAKKLLLKGMTPVEISEVTGLSLETILELKENV